jgi:hypothetical protein
LKETIVTSEQRMMMGMMQDHFGEMLVQNTNELKTYLDIKATQNADAMFDLVASLRQPTNDDNKTPSPSRKHPRLQTGGTPMVDVTQLTATTSPQNPFPNGNKDARGPAKIINARKGSPDEANLHMPHSP